MHGREETLGSKAVSAFIVIAGFAAVAIAVVVGMDARGAVPAMIVAGILAFITVNAITVSFHRELTHKALRMRRWLSLTYATLGSMAVEGAVLSWVAHHRKHHHHSDEEGDPHSPHRFGSGAWNIVKGFLHAHIGWFFHEPQPDKERYVRDLMKDRALVMVDRLFPLWAVLSFLIPGFLVLIFEPSFQGFLMGVLWGGFVRVFFVHHLTWSINSVCHLWGTRPFRARDQSANNLIFGILGQGEGWHRNHHAFMRSARIGLRPWEIDIGWYTILVLRALGLAKDVVVPSQDELVRKSSPA